MGVIESLFELLGVFAPLAIAVTAVILALLSKRLGDVTHTPPYFRWCYVSAGLACWSAFFQLLFILSKCSCGTESGLLYKESFYVLTYSIPLAVSLVICAAVTWRYWGWLLDERDE
jgi:hypothetical protein